ncbi:phage tail protein [Halomonas sp. BC04]|uniref:phage tail protein n=1 Tax=Halomonas sp. BC04 TaxID=1403540 RepID=UPI0003ED7E2D|nr:phage tail protein [Halomonas sp. BC04]EWH02050.1 oxidoreductase [Halomonas sp. BC04]
MMMVFGLFVFSLSTTAYQELQRQSDWRYPPQSRVGARPSRQFLGPGDDTITLTGTLLPEFTGGQRHLDELRRMAGEGKAWPLIEGTGRNYGLFVIENLSERKSRFFRDGAASQIDFDLTLQRIDDDDHQRLAVLDAATLRLVRGLFA